MKTLIALLLLATVAQAEIIAYKFADGHIYVNTPSGPERVKIVELPTDGGPTDPDDPVPNPTDKFGLIKVSKDAADAIPEYEKKDQHRATLAAAFEGISQSVNSGLVKSSELKAAVSTSLTILLGSDRPKWDGWYSAINAKMDSALNVPTATKADAVLALSDVGKGLVPVSDRSRVGPLVAEGFAPAGAMAGESLEAINWAELIKFFIEVILPLILTLIKTSAWMGLAVGGLV